MKNHETTPPLTPFTLAGESGSSTRSPGYGENPFQSTIAQERQSDLVDTRPALGERLKNKLGTVLNIGSFALGGMMSRMASDTLTSKAPGRAEQIGRLYAKRGDAQQAFDTVRTDAANVWGDRSSHLQKAVNYAGNMALETAKTGGLAALGSIGEQVGISYEKERGVHIDMIALGKAVGKFALAPQATAVNIGRNAAAEGLQAAKQEGHNQLDNARADGRDAFAGYARNVIK